MDKKVKLPESILANLQIFRLSLREFSFNQSYLENLLGHVIDISKEYYVQPYGCREIPVTINNELNQYEVIYLGRRMKY